MRNFNRLEKHRWKIKKIKLCLSMGSKWKQCNSKWLNCQYLSWIKRKQVICSIKQWAQKVPNYLSDPRKVPTRPRKIWKIKYIFRRLTKRNIDPRTTIMVISTEGSSQKPSALDRIRKWEEMVTVSMMTINLRGIALKFWLTRSLLIRLQQILRKIFSIRIQPRS